MFKIDTREIKKMGSDLKTFGRWAYPFASKNTVNRSAFEAQRNAREIVSSNMTLRNKHTLRTIQVEQTHTLNVSRQEAIVGSTADYMEDQEFGGRKVKTGKEGVSITTSYAAGQGLNAQPRTRAASKPNKMANIQLRKRRTKGNQKQRNLVVIKQAAESGSKYVFLELGRRQGIFKVIGGKRRPRIKMVHDLSHKSVDIPKNPWLAPAVKRTEARIPEFYAKSLEFQLKRLGLFD